jgi:hypothetical protein
MGKAIVIESFGRLRIIGGRRPVVCSSSASPYPFPHTPLASILAGRRGT